MLKTDAFFKTQVSQFSKTISQSEGFDLRAGIRVFHEAAAVPQSSSSEISVRLTLYFMANVSPGETNEKKLLCAQQTNDFIEMAMRIEIDQFSSFVQNLRFGATRDSDLLS